MDTIWEFNTANFTVICEALPEIDPDLSWADEETLERLESGEYVNLCWHVGVFHNGHEIGSDYLGNSVYANPDDFLRNGYFFDMVRSAIADARRTLAAN